MDRWIYLFVRLVIYHSMIFIIDTSFDISIYFMGLTGFDDYLIDETTVLWPDFIEIRHCSHQSKTTFPLRKDGFPRIYSQAYEGRSFHGL